MINQLIQSLNKKVESSGVKVSKILEQTDKFPQVLLKKWGEVYTSVKAGEVQTELSGEIHILDQATFVDRAERLKDTILDLHQRVDELGITGFKVFYFEFTQATFDTTQDGHIIYTIKFETTYQEDAAT